MSAKNLINAQDQQYINVGEDDILLTAIRKKGEIDLEFLKREEVLARLKDHMQSWYEIRVEGRDVVRKFVCMSPHDGIAMLIATCAGKASSSQSRSS